MKILMHTDNTSQIDKENPESVQRVDSLLTLIAKVMVDRDLRSKEAKKDKIDDGERDCKTTNQPDKV
jgi:hypothetical protein